MLGRMITGLLQLRGNSAERCYRDGTAARERGDWAQAIDLYRRTLAARPDHAEAHNDLGIALCAIADFAGARTAFEQALALREDLVPAQVNLGQLLLSEFRDYRGAAEHFRAALALNPAQEQARTALALALYESGLVEEAVKCLHETMRLFPENALAHQFLLFMSNALPQRDPGAWYAEHRAWGERHVDGLPRFEHPPLQPKQRLRIGYVSADFREHATASFVRTILSGHDHRAFDIFCYSNSADADAMTAELRPLAHGWRGIESLDDTQAAQSIRADGIDILVDLSGHTRGNRLALFARKPAPVQLSYLGYLNTTGVAAMDFRITDACADPPGASERFHSETLLRMPQTLWCYQPPGDAPPVSPLPSEENGYITFGSFNHVAKLNAGALALWGRLLHRLPGARLQVIAVPDEYAADKIRASLQAQGVDPERISTLPRLSREQYWHALGQVDIALDPFPYTGGATTCESVWMGLPVVTLAGDFGFARSAATVLINAGLADCVATDEQQYLETACRLAEDRTALANLRRGMRGRLEGSPLLDATRFVVALEQLYRDAWQRRCAPGHAPC